MLRCCALSTRLSLSLSLSLSPCVRAGTARSRSLCRPHCACAVCGARRFGWVTGTGIKIFLVTHDRRLHERSVTTLLEALHVAFADAVCGPFTDVDDPSEALGAAFAAKVDAVTAAAADSLPAV